MGVCWLIEPNIYPTQLPRERSSEAQIHIDRNSRGMPIATGLYAGFRGHIHITEASDAAASNPLERLKVGENVRAVVLGASPGLHGHRPQHGVVELTLRESALTKADAGAAQKLEARLNKDNVKLHSTVTGCEFLPLRPLIGMWGRYRQISIVG